MDHKKKDYIQAMDDFSPVNLLKKAIQILIPISVFSLLYSQPSLLNALLHHFDSYFSASTSIKLFNYNSERNYIFLLFNGILALIIKNSGLISKPSMNSSSKANKILIKNDHDPDQLSEKKAEEVLKKDVAEVEEHGKEDGNLINVKGEENLLLPVAEDLNDEDQEHRQNITAEEEEEEEEEVGLLSTEELNRKCDDFIKKMRGGIKIEIYQRILV